MTFVHRLNTLEKRIAVVEMALRRINPNLVEVLMSALDDLMTALKTLEDEVKVTVDTLHNVEAKNNEERVAVAKRLKDAHDQLAVAVGEVMASGGPTT